MYATVTPPLAVIVCAPASKTALIVTAEFGMVNVVVAFSTLTKFILDGVTASQRTNLLPDVGFAVIVTVAPFAAAPVLWVTVPKLTLFD